MLLSNTRRSESRAERLALRARLTKAAAATPATPQRAIAISCIYVYHLIQEYFLILESGKPQLAQR